MKATCPNSTCMIFNQTLFQLKDGFFIRRSQVLTRTEKVQRFRCKICRIRYSVSTTSPERYLKRRDINPLVRKCLSSSMSMRACAYNLGIARETVRRRLKIFSELAKIKQARYLKRLEQNPLDYVQFDDLITSIHTKLKPAAISVVIDPQSYMILGARVSEILAFGLIAKISRAKYGPRKNKHPETLSKLISELKGAIDPYAKFRTDDHRRYGEIIAKHFPNAKHEIFKSKRAAVVGMGELKTKSYDPLFAINQTLACFRAGICRLVRQTWNTSKDIERLQMHVDLFIDYHNERKMKLRRAYA